MSDTHNPDDYDGWEREHATDHADYLDWLADQESDLAEAEDVRALWPVEAGASVAAAWCFLDDAGVADPDSALRSLVSYFLAQPTRPSMPS